MLRSCCPFTVDADNNPLHNRPEDLSGDHRGLGASSWKPRGEPHHVPLCGLPMVCWKTIWVFCEGDGQETDWMMTQYAITVSNESVSMCRIGKSPTNHVTGDPFPFDDFRNHSNNCPLLTVVNQEISRVLSEGDFLELDDLEGPPFLTKD